MEIQIFGETVTIKHNFGVQEVYEDLFEEIGKPQIFDLQSMTNSKNRLVLYYATIVFNNKESKITIDDIRTADIDTLNVLDKAVFDSILEWRKIPKVTNDPALTEEHTDEEKKV